MNAALAKLGLPASATRFSPSPQAAFPYLNVNIGSHRTDRGLVQIEQVNLGWSYFLVEIWPIVVFNWIFNNYGMNRIYMRKGPQEFHSSNHRHTSDGGLL